MVKHTPYDKNLVGPLLDIGAHHLIRRYGQNQVIKFPVGLPFRLNRKQWCENLRRDSQILKQYFGPYLSESQIFFFLANKQPSYVIIEPFCRGRHLHKRDLRDQAMRQQFSDIVGRNDRLKRREHLSLDFFGIKGLLWKGRREVCNIMLEDKTQGLRIIDMVALHFGRTRDQQIIVSFLTALALKLQRRLLKKLLKA